MFSVGGVANISCLLILLQFIVYYTKNQDFKWVLTHWQTKSVLLTTPQTNTCMRPVCSDFSQCKTLQLSPVSTVCTTCVNLHQLFRALDAPAALMTQTRHEVTTGWVEPAAHNWNTIIWQQVVVIVTLQLLLLLSRLEYKFNGLINCSLNLWISWHRDCPQLVRLFFLFSVRHLFNNIEIQK